MKLKSNVAVSDSGFVFNAATGDSYSINPIGQFIFNLIKNGATEEEVIKHILKKYSVDRPTAEKDLYDFKKILESYKLIDTTNE